MWGEDGLLAMDSSIIIIYNSTWSILIQWIRVMIVRWQSDQLKTKESIHFLFVINLITLMKEKYRKREEIEVLWNYAFPQVGGVRWTCRMVGSQVWCEPHICLMWGNSQRLVGECCWPIESVELDHWSR